VRSSEELAKRQREWPLGPAGDRGAAFFARLTPLTEPSLEAKRISQTLIAGEVSRPLPNAKTFHYADGSHAIMIFSGLIDFYDSVARILFGATNVYGKDETIKPSNPMESVIANLQALFECWTPQGIAENRAAALSQSPLPPSAEALAALLAESALLFVLSHELGHVLYYRPPTNAKAPATPKLSQAQEFASDVSGMRHLVGASHGSEARMRLTGVVVSLRVLAVFSALGHSFPDDHPQPAKRLASVMKSARSFCSTERDYWSLSPIAYSYDEQLETAGLRALHGDAHPAPRADRIFSRLSAVLENAAQGIEPPSAVLKVMQYDFREASPEVLEEVAQTAARMFPPTSVETGSTSENPLWSQKANVFHSLDDQWPDRAKAAFQHAFHKLYSNGGLSHNHVNHGLPQ
jgi:hypothetical protein